MTTLDEWDLVEGFEQGRDFHAENAQLIFKIDKPTEAQREVGKTLTYTTLYGGGPGKIAESLTLSFPEAKRLYNTFHRARPELGRLSTAIVETAKARGYILTLGNRHLHWGDKEHTYLNKLLQGSAAEVMKRALLNCARGLKAGKFESHMVASIHDELIFDCKESEIPKLVKLIPRWMNWPEVSKIIPIKTSIEIAPKNWGEKEVYSVHSG